MAAPITTVNPDGTKTVIFTENAKVAKPRKEVAKPVKKSVKPVKIVKLTKETMLQDFKKVEAAKAAWEKNDNKKTLDSYRAEMKKFAEEYTPKLGDFFKKPLSEGDEKTLENMKECAIDMGTKNTVFGFLATTRFMVKINEVLG